MIATHHYDEADRLLRLLGPDAAKAHLRRQVKRAIALQSGMLSRVDREGRQLYRMTAGGNIVRTRPIKAHMKRRILKRDGYRCVQCGATDFLEVAHIEAYRVNGNNDDDNLRILCNACHAAEGVND